MRSSGMIVKNIKSPNMTSPSPMIFSFPYSRGGMGSVLFFLFSWWREWFIYRKIKKHREHNC